MTFRSMPTAPVPADVLPISAGREEAARTSAKPWLGRKRVAFVPLFRSNAAPPDASFSAMPRPIPLVEPVTSAVLLLIMPQSLKRSRRMSFGYTTLSPCENIHSISSLVIRSGVVPFAAHRSSTRIWRFTSEA